MCCRWPKLISLWSPVMQLHPEKISFQSGFCALDPPLSCILKISACWLESRALSHTRKSLGKSEIDLQRDQIMRGHPEDSLTERKREKKHHCMDSCWFLTVCLQYVVSGRDQWVLHCEKGKGLVNIHVFGNSFVSNFFHWH